MTAPRSSSPTNPTAWQALREYLVDAYSNREMRLLIELTLLAEAGSRLPDERVAPQEFAETLCALIQRHSRVPAPEFWRQLAADRPLRDREIARLRAFFHGVVNEPLALTSPAAAHRPGWRRITAPRLLTACLISALGAAATYCAVTSAPTTAPKPRVMCRDGTPSKTCDEPHPGCCSRHGGLADEAN